MKDQSLFRICAIGDIVGRAGRKSVVQALPRLHKEYAPDMIIANGENCAGGFGITKKIFLEATKKWGVHIISTGNHWHDKKEIFSFKPDYPQLLLPANMYNVPNIRDGFHVIQIKGVQCAVINLTGRVFMKGENRCPFQTFDEIVKEIGEQAKIIVVDFHGEATSEKQAFAHYTRKRLSLLYGTHTHCPTADERIFDQYSGYITDVGMTGSYDSVIGVRAENSLSYFLGSERKKFEPANKDPWFCAIIADFDPATGACLHIQRLRWEIDKECLDLPIK